MFKLFSGKPWFVYCTAFLLLLSLVFFSVFIRGSRFSFDSSGESSLLTDQKKQLVQSLVDYSIVMGPYFDKADIMLFIATKPEKNLIIAYREFFSKKRQYYEEPFGFELHLISFLNRLEGQLSSSHGALKVGPERVEAFKVILQPLIVQAEIARFSMVDKIDNLLKALKSHEKRTAENSISISMSSVAQSEDVDRNLNVQRIEKKALELFGSSTGLTVNQKETLLREPEIKDALDTVLQHHELTVYDRLKKLEEYPEIHLPITILNMASFDLEVFREGFLGAKLEVFLSGRDSIFGVKDQSTVSEMEASLFYFWSVEQFLILVSYLSVETVYTVREAESQEFYKKITQMMKEKSSSGCWNNQPFVYNYLNKIKQYAVLTQYPDVFEQAIRSFLVQYPFYEAKFFQLLQYEKEMRSQQKSNYAALSISLRELMQCEGSNVSHLLLLSHELRERSRMVGEKRQVFLEKINLELGSS